MRPGRGPSRSTSSNEKQYNRAAQRRTHQDSHASLRATMPRFMCAIAGRTVAATPTSRARDDAGSGRCASSTLSARGSIQAVRRDQMRSVVDDGSFPRAARYPRRAVPVVDDDFDAGEHGERNVELVVGGAKRDRSDQYAAWCFGRAPPKTAPARGGSCRVGWPSSESPRRRARQAPGAPHHGRRRDWAHRSGRDHRAVRARSGPGATATYSSNSVPPSTRQRRRVIGVSRKLIARRRYRRPDCPRDGDTPAPSLPDTAWRANRFWDAGIATEFGRQSQR